MPGSHWHLPACNRAAAGGQELPHNVASPAQHMHVASSAHARHQLSTCTACCSPSAGVAEAGGVVQRPAVARQVGLAAQALGHLQQRRQVDLRSQRAASMHRPAPHARHLSACRSGDICRSAQGCGSAATRCGGDAGAATASEYADESSCQQEVCDNNQFAYLLEEGSHARALAGGGRPACAGCTEGTKQERLTLLQTGTSSCLLMGKARQMISRESVGLQIRCLQADW